MRYNYQTGHVNWDYITADLDTDRSGGDIIYGYMGVHPTTEQLWVGKSTYTRAAFMYTTFRVAMQPKSAVSTSGKPVRQA